MVSDFDGTFSEDLNENIKYANKFIDSWNLFVIATGSSYQSYVDKLKNNVFKASYVIVNHGSLIIKNDNVIFEKYLSNDLLNSIYEAIMNSNCKSYFYCLEDAISFKNEMLRKYGNYINCYLMYETLIEIVSINASKIIAINKIIELENIDKDNVYTVGDGYNDIDMIKGFNGYAIKNSVNELKKVAKRQVDSVYELIKEISSK